MAKQAKWRPSVRPSERCGFTLVEVLVSTLIMGVVLVGAMKLVSGVFRTHSINEEIVDGPLLAEQIMAEILAAPYEDPEEPTGGIGLETGESGGTTRAAFDDVDDYDGWNQDPPAFKDGSPVPNASGWKRIVQITFKDPTDGSNSNNDLGLKEIRITVVPPVGDDIILIARRARWGAVEQPMGADATLITHLQVELQVGLDTPSVIRGVQLINHAEDQ